MCAEPRPRAVSLWHDDRRVALRRTPPRPACRGDLDVRRRHRRGRLHRPLDRVLPARGATRRCGSSCSRRRSPGSAPPAATAAGARRCSPRRSTSSPRLTSGRDAALALHAAMRATVDEVGGSPRARASTRTPPRAAPSGWPARAPSWPGPGPRSREARRGAAARTTSAARGRRGARRAQRDPRRRRDVHPRLRGDPARAAGPRAWPRPSSGTACAIFERTRVTAIAARPGRRPTTARSAREHVVRATEGYTPDLAGHRRAVVPVYSLIIATEPLRRRGVGRDRPARDARRSAITGT